MAQAKQMAMENKVDMSPFGVKANALNMLSDWKNDPMRVTKCTQSQQQGSSRTWSKPPPGWVKINVDAACVPGAGYVRLGCVIRDEFRAFVKARSNVLRVNMQAREAEASIEFERGFIMG